ncbi:MAG: sigma-70 family RNA polymerase sigma factor [Chloroflexi bacterium]|nr:sigma-70 family RNA polymerase sigma factor [Ardenticatenaceae bacterium]MBL1129301.1 sigma-70 family RNA polymerase sigma factor [Chloroflexota bacterium]NOG35377.1 sigma-70 family RNA polymerase sigma factor [Chloroflexota bacterium]GIK58607.1 MAG: RNA polymerase sigma factor SigX [Chloroflexota bacterium]
MGDANNSEPEKETAVTALSDNLLLERISQGDAASFEAVFYAHYDRVYGLLFRLMGNRDEAEDLTQEVFLQLHHHAYRRRLFNLQREHNIGAWLYRTATNMGYNAIRGRQRRWQRNLVLVPDAAGSPGVDKEVERQEQATAVRRTLARLPERQTQLLLMRQMGFSYQECAQVCGVAPGSVGTLLARANKAFKQVYEEEMGVGG